MLLLGIDTYSGETTIIFNDRTVLDDVFQYFVGSNSLMPGNLTGKINLGRWFFQDNWLQSLATVANLNIFPRKLRTEEMLKRTQTLECNPFNQSGLAWNTLNWNFIGDKIKVMEVEEEELCNQDKTYLFSLENPLSWHECTRNCHKILKARMPSLLGPERSEKVTRWFMERMFLRDNITDTLLPFPSGCNRFWLPITDIAEDGVWVDDNSGENVTYFDWKKGEPNGGINQNCGNLVPPGRLNFGSNPNPNTSQCIFKVAGQTDPVMSANAVFVKTPFNLI